MCKYRYMLYVFFLNQFCVLLFLGYEYRWGELNDMSNIFPLLLITLIAGNIVYLVSVNLNNSRIISRYAILLLIINWYFLLNIEKKGLDGLHPEVIGSIILYLIVRFMLSFIFQGDSYKFSKQFNLITMLLCIITVFMRFINDRGFAMSLLLQLMVTVLGCAGVFLINRKRASFTVKSHWKYFAISYLVAFMIFASYIGFFGKEKGYLDNLGVYILVFLSMFSINNIIYSRHDNVGLWRMVKKTQWLSVVAGAIVIFGVIGWIIKIQIGTVFLISHGLICVYPLYFIKPGHKDGWISNKGYTSGIKILLKEESIKGELSSYLHDEILQDLLAIKNMMTKADQDEIRQLIIQALDKMNRSIRIRMQDYHPTISSNLALKENYDLLIDNIVKMHASSKLIWNLEMKYDLFIAEPYNLLVYRIIRELVTNALKHSQCTEIKIAVSELNQIICVSVQDNGKGKLENFNDISNFSGLRLLKEQIDNIDGKFIVDNVEGGGLDFRIEFLMEGCRSYESYINR